MLAANVPRRGRTFYGFALGDGAQKVWEFTVQGLVLEVQEL